MRTRVVCLILSAAAAVAVVVPVTRTETVPLAGIKLVAERVASPAEVAAASRNGTRNGSNGNRGGAATAGFAVAKATWFVRRVDDLPAPDLVAVAMR